MARAVVAHVRVVGVHLHCHLCGDHAHLAVPPGVDDIREWITGPGGTWMTCHRDPHLFAVDLTVNGVPTTMRSVGNPNPAS